MSPPGGPPTPTGALATVSTGRLPIPERLRPPLRRGATLIPGTPPHITPPIPPRFASATWLPTAHDMSLIPRPFTQTTANAAPASSAPPAHTPPPTCRRGGPCGAIAAGCAVTKPRRPITSRRYRGVEATGRRIYGRSASRVTAARAPVAVRLPGLRAQVASSRRGRGWCRRSLLSLTNVHPFCCGSVSSRALVEATCTDNELRARGSREVNGKPRRRSGSQVRRHVREAADLAQTS
jgi:hypothetical protein